MACVHRFLDSIDGLLCTRLTPHDPLAAGGHTYDASAGPDLDNDSSKGKR